MQCKLLLLAAVLYISAGSCKKDGNKTAPSIPPVDTTTENEEIPDPYQGFIHYTIQKGENYCDDNKYELIEGAHAIDFLVAFDSSCIYTNADPANQMDINKLMGFSDCNTLHQVNSARFGWNWMEGKIYIYAYCYNNSERMYKTLSAVPLNSVQHLKIYPDGHQYIFEVNGRKDSMPRFCSDPVITGYKLLPYFGGDEPAPHTMHIRIKYQ